jgi:WD40 repeat protein
MRPGSSDGRVIALGSGHKGALVWSCRAGNWGVAVLFDSAGRTVNCIALSSDGTLVVTGDDSGEFSLGRRLWARCCVAFPTGTAVQLPRLVSR